MEIVVLGLNHKTAPIDIREKFYLSPIQQKLFLSELKSDPSVAEAFIISTCNRTEIYLHTVDQYTKIDPILKRISKIRNESFDLTHLKYFYYFTNEKAVEHLLRVTTGLDSLVVGEKQILGQVKDSFECARAMGTLGRHFNILSNLALRAGKKAQSETEISFGGSSIGWAAVTMAEQTLGKLTEKSMLIIGAGKMSEITVEQICHRGLKQLYLMSRTGETAKHLADKHNAIAIASMDMKDVLTTVDICVCAADAPHYILDAPMMQRIAPLRKTPLLFIDISMPRNIDPKIGELDGMKLFYVDDLSAAICNNLQKRQTASREVEKIVADKINDFYTKLSKIDELISSDVAQF